MDGVATLDFPGSLLQWPTVETSKEAQKRCSGMYLRLSRIALSALKPVSRPIIGEPKTLPASEQQPSVFRRLQVDGRHTAT
jgi:hypothetical protein